MKVNPFDMPEQLELFNYEKVIYHPEKDVETQKKLCNDCKGKGKYVGLFKIDICKKCKGTGTVSNNSDSLQEI